MTDDAEHADATDWRTRAEAAERALTDAAHAAEQRLIRAELKAEALRAGMVDLDGIKLIETDGLALTEKGDLAGGAALMATLRQHKPWLFGGQSSSATARVPSAQAPKSRLATEMNHDEWRTARADLLRHR